MTTYQKITAFKINPFHRDSFDTEAYVFRIRGAEDPAAFYREKTRDVQAILQDHLDRGVSLRAIGSSWSLSDVGVCPGAVVCTGNWNQVFSLTHEGTVDPLYRGKAKGKKGLCLVEAGVCMTDLDEYLLNRKLSVKAHGSNNGQSIVGAASTNTHGGAFEFGSIHDSIVGIHLVATPDESIYLERASYPVLTSDWARKSLGARSLRDDALFHAALVGFGALGIVRSVVIETRPLFTLEARLFQHKLTRGLKDAMSKYDFSKVRTRIAGKAELVPDWLDGRELYHFEVIFNPNDPANDDPKTAKAYVRLMLADPDLKGWVDPPTEPADLSPHATETMARILAAFGPVGKLTRMLLNDQVKQYFAQVQVRAPMRYMFRGQVPAPSAFASGIAMPAERSPEAFDIALRVYRNLNQMLPMLVSGRYVKGTAATLGYTRFPNTCVLELDGIRDVGVEEYFDLVLAELQAAGIPFALHWAKAIGWYDHAQNLQAAYGTAIADWKACRQRLLPTAGLRAVFANDFLTRVGLA